MNQQPNPFQTDAAHVALPEYVCVFDNPQPPQEHEFTAMSDQHATEMMRKTYPGYRWTLYEITQVGRRSIFTHREEDNSGEASQM